MGYNSTTNHSLTFRRRRALLMTAVMSFRSVSVISNSLRLRICLITIKSLLYPTLCWPDLQERCQRYPELAFLAVFNRLMNFTWLQCESVVVNSVDSPTAVQCSMTCHLDFIIVKGQFKKVELTMKIWMKGSRSYSRLLDCTPTNPPRPPR